MTGTSGNWRRRAARWGGCVFTDSQTEGMCMEQPFPQQQQQQHPQQQSIVTERELPMLAGIGAVVTWFEDLLNILSGPVITAGLVIALVALLTDGDLLVKVPAMLYIWSVSMALGLDAQFVGSAAKMARAARQRKWLAVFGYGVLCAALGYVGYIASNVFATQEAEGITTAQALSHLGMDGSTWILQRSLLAVILVFLSGYLRYVAPAKQAKSVALSAAEEAERLRAEIELAPLRAQARAAQIRGMRGAVLTAVGREQQQQQPAQPSFRAAYTTPQAQPPTEHVIAANKMMHDWDIPDEVEDDDEDIGGWQTGVIEAIGDVSATDVPTSTKRRSRSQSNSGPKRTHQQASKTVRQTHKKMRLEAKQARKRAVRDGAFSIFDDLAASGDSLSNGEVGRRVRAMQHLETTPSDNTIARLRGAWKSSRMHKQVMDQEEQPIVSEETMAELAMAEALP
jgi:hypothetical protein